MLAAALLGLGAPFHRVGKGSAKEIRDDQSVERGRDRHGQAIAAKRARCPDHPTERPQCTGQADHRPHVGRIEKKARRGDCMRLSTRPVALMFPQHRFQRPATNQGLGELVEFPVADMMGNRTQQAILVDFAQLYRQFGTNAPAVETRTQQRSDLGHGDARLGEAAAENDAQPGSSKDKAGENGIEEQGHENGMLLRPKNGRRAGELKTRKNFAAFGNPVPEAPAYQRDDGLRSNWHDPCIAIGAKEVAMTGTLFGIHGAALEVRAQRMGMISANIANAATPGYKARDLDFAQALANRLADQPSDKAEGSAVRYRTPVMPSADGNTVEMATEQSAFAENAVGYMATLNFIRARVDGVTRALRGE